MKAVIFDMDGVIVDSEPYHYDIEKILYKKRNIPVPEEVHKTYIGTAGDYMWGDLKQRFGLVETLDELLEWDDLFRIKYFDNLDKLELNPGLKILLEEIKSAGIEMSVATSSSPGVADIVLRKCDVLNYFKHVVTTEYAGKSKPAPDVYLAAARSLGVEPGSCLAFEDSTNGIKAAVAAGMYCVAYQPKGHAVQDVSLADYVISDFSLVTVENLKKMML